MNRTDRLYAIVEELRAVAPRPRSARWLAGRFEVSARTIERDISALQQSGVPIWAEPGRTGGYCLDKARTLPPVNLTPGEAVALAVALRQLDGTPFLADAGTALRKLVTAMQAGDAAAAQELAERDSPARPARRARRPPRCRDWSRTRCSPGGCCGSATPTGPGRSPSGRSSRLATSARPPPTGT